ncbi:MAG: hypothetical protein BM562_18415 [Alphaproteobacteria bacterium MedPE-SWcel]|nr:MAG: hypothetical protein BM562_18415 [Alphaproteobacteria bacterium MedPE-SWcel]
MSEFIDYAKELMESAKGFAEKGKSEKDPKLKQAYLRASLMHGFSFLEAHLNELADHFRSGKTLPVHERGILLEREVRLDKGGFKLTATPKFSKIIDRIEVILKNFCSDVAAAKGDWFTELGTALHSRNKLVHPKEKHELSHKEVLKSLKAFIDCIDALFVAVFKKGFPYKGKSLEGGYDL